MNTGLGVMDAMTRQPVTVSPDISVLRCAKVMEQERVGSVLVVQKNRLVGIVTEQDIVYRTVARDKPAKRLKVKEIMSADLKVISPDKDITDAIECMARSNVRRLPVLDGQALVGMITLKDIVKIEPQLFERIVDQITLREEEFKPVPAGTEGLCAFCGEYSTRLTEEDNVFICKDCKALSEPQTSANF